jgi:hypothetical protein
MANLLSRSPLSVHPMAFALHWFPQGVAAKTNEAPGTANPIWGERLELPLPKLIKVGCVCCVAVTSQRC